MGTRKIRSDKGGHHNYPKRNKNVAADIKISNKQQLLNLINANLETLTAEHNTQLAVIKGEIKKYGTSPTYESLLKEEEALPNEVGKTFHTLLKLKANLENRRMVTTKALKIYSEMIFSPGAHLTREQRGGKLLLNMLSRYGVDVSDTTAIRKALGGYTPKEIYDAWLDMGHDSEDWYETTDSDEITVTIDEIVAFLNERAKQKDPALDKLLGV